MDQPLKSASISGEGLPGAGDMIDPRSVASSKLGCASPQIQHHLYLFYIYIYLLHIYIYIILYIIYIIIIYILYTWYHLHQITPAHFCSSHNVWGKTGTTANPLNPCGPRAFRSSHLWFETRSHKKWWPLHHHDHSAYEDNNDDDHNNDNDNDKWQWW